MSSSRKKGSIARSRKSFQASSPRGGGTGRRGGGRGRRRGRGPSRGCREGERAERPAAGVEPAARGRPDAFAEHRSLRVPQLLARAARRSRGLLPVHPLEAAVHERPPQGHDPRPGSRPRDRPRCTRTSRGSATRHGVVRPIEDAVHRRATGFLEQALGRGERRRSHVLVGGRGHGTRRQAEAALDAVLVALEVVDRRRVVRRPAGTRCSAWSRSVRGIARRTRPCRRRGP